MSTNKQETDIEVEVEKQSGGNTHACELIGWWFLPQPGVFFFQDQETAWRSPNRICEKPFQDSRK